MKNTGAPQVMLVVLGILVVYVSVYLALRRTDLGWKAYIATEDFYFFDQPLNKPSRTHFSHIGQTVFAYFYFPLTSIDYRMNGHVYIF